MELPDSQMAGASHRKLSSPLGILAGCQDTGRYQGDADPNGRPLGHGAAHPPAWQAAPTRPAGKVRQAPAEAASHPFSYGPLDQSQFQPWVLGIPPYVTEPLHH